MKIVDSDSAWDLAPLSKQLPSHAPRVLTPSAPLSLSYLLPCSPEVGGGYAVGLKAGSKNQANKYAGEMTVCVCVNIFLCVCEWVFVGVSVFGCSAMSHTYVACGNNGLYHLR